METLLYPDCFYHIYNHSVGNDNIFVTEENYKFFLERYIYYIYPIARTYAYCLLPNHFHFLVLIRSEQELNNINEYKNNSNKEQFLSKQFSNLFSSYTQSFNKLYQRRGNLFIKSYKRKIVSDGAYYTKLICYIHYNPVHHNIVTNIYDWKYSSFLSLLKENVNTKIEKEQVLKMFGNKDKFLDFHLKNRWLELNEY